MLYDRPYYISDQIELENTTPNAFGPYDMNECCGVATKKIKPTEHTNVSFAEYQSYEWWLNPHSITVDREPNYNQGVVKVDVRQDKVLEANRVRLNSTWVSQMYQENLRSEKLDHMSVVEQVIQFWQRGRLFSDAVESVYYDMT